MNALALLRPLGIGVCVQRVSLSPGVSPLCLRVAAAVPLGSLLALVPRGAVWDVNSVVDADDCGLAPPPADVAAAFSGGPRAAAALDVAVLAHFLAQRCCLTGAANAWHAAALQTFAGAAPADSPPSPSSLSAEEVSRLHAALAESYASPPLPLFAAAAAYVSERSFFCANAGDSVARRHVAPLLDALLAGAADPRGATAANVSCRVLTAPQALEALKEPRNAGVRGARQQLRGRGDKYPYVAVTAARDIQEGETLRLTRDNEGGKPLLVFPSEATD